MFQLKTLQKATILIFLVTIFITVNLLLSPFSLKLDLSKGQAYSLSNSTKNIVDKLKQPVTIKFYVSSDIPTRLIPLKNDVVDLLNEYKRESNRVDVKIVDPKTNTAAADEAKTAGIPPLQFSQMDQDKYAVSTAYFGIMISYQDKQEILPQVTDTSSLEYDLTSAIYKLTNTNTAKIEVIGQNGTGDPNTNQLTSLTKVLQQQFTVDFNTIIDPTAKTIMIFDDGKKGYTDDEIASLKKYLDEGGKIIFFVDKVWVADSLATQPAKNNLEKLFQKYGISENNDLILSANAELVNFGSSQSSFYMEYPFWLKTNVFNNKSSYFASINQLTFPWASSINIDKKNSLINPLVYSTSQSWEQKNTFILDPQMIPQPNMADIGQKLLMVDVKGKNNGEFVLIPTSRFVLDKYLSQSSDNLGLILNITNDFASSGALSGIRQRQVSFYPLPDLTDNMKNVFKYTNILLLPLAFAIYGAIRLIKRK